MQRRKEKNEKKKSKKKQEVEKREEARAEEEKAPFGCSSVDPDPSWLGTHHAMGCLLSFSAGRRLSIL